MKYPVIIAFECINGQQSMIQMHRLERLLKQRQMRVETLSFPNYSGWVGKEIGKFFTAANGNSAFQIDKKSMAAWFALDRQATFSMLDLSDTDIVLIDRYVLSTLVYQGIRDTGSIESKREFYNFVCILEHEKLKNPHADIYVLLDVQPELLNYNDALYAYNTETTQFKAREEYLRYLSILDNIILIPCSDGNKLMPDIEIAMQLESELLTMGLI